MNCEEFHNQLLTDPYCDDASFRAHARACPECARAVDEALRFEQSLRTALSAELSPSGEQISQRSGSMRSASRYALLALPLLIGALWFGLQSDFGPDSADDLAALVIGHIQLEEEHLRATGRIPESSLRLLFRSLGAEVDASLGPVSFAGRCVIGEREGIHLVLPGEQGAVTALFIPGSDASEEHRISEGGFVGSIIPAGSGSVAIVGRPGEPLEPVARRLHSAVRWSSQD